ncbi:aldo/keto reductase [Candidatus Latescibacterota bacterium]
MSREKITRRQFITSTAALCGTALLPSCTAPVSTPTAVDQVTLGKTGLKLSRLGFGTGTLNSGDVQIALGQDGFNRLLRYAYDQGITYIDTSVGYKTMPWMRDALKGIPRENLFIQSKLERRVENPREAIDTLRKDLGVEYIDSLLVHAVRSATWDEESKMLMDALEEAKAKKIILAHGASYHGIPALQTSAGLDWVDVNLIRYNPQGVNIDTPSLERGVASDASHVPMVEEQMSAMREKRQGIIGMKILGEGVFAESEDREKSIRYVMQSGLVDAIVIGFKSPAEIDEAVWRMNRALAEEHADARYREAV